MLLSIAGVLQTDCPEVILRTSRKVRLSVPLNRWATAGQVTEIPIHGSFTSRGAELCSSN